MFCWHKWNKWSEIKQEEWAQQSTRCGILIGDITHIIRYCQDRTCDKCGKYQKRYIN